MSHTPEPFGYFKAEPFGWTDCAETEDEAIPLWDNAALLAIEKQRDELLSALYWLLNRAAPEWETESGLIEYTEACKHARSIIANVKGAAS